MCVRKAPSAEIGHGVRFPPDDVIENPEAGVLQRRPDAEDVVVAADNPERPIWFQKPASLGKPATCKAVVGRKVMETIPSILDAVHPRVVGPMKFTLKLEIVGRIGKDHVDALSRQGPHDLDAVPKKNAVERQFLGALFSTLAFAAACCRPYRRAGGPSHLLSADCSPSSLQPPKRVPWCTHFDDLLTGLELAVTGFRARRSTAARGTASYFKDSRSRFGSRVKYLEGAADEWG